MENNTTDRESTSQEMSHEEANNAIIIISRLNNSEKQLFNVISYIIFFVLKFRKEKI
jgi:hypothetical protein